MWAVDKDVGDDNDIEAHTQNMLAFFKYRNELKLKLINSKIRFNVFELKLFEKVFPSAICWQRCGERYVGA